MNANKSSNLISALQFFSKAASAIVFAIGCVVIVGWIFDIATLKSILPGLVTMKANTAIAFIFAGASLWYLVRQTRKTNGAKNNVFATSFAVIVILIGLLTLLQYGFGWNLGIDQFFFKEAATAVGTSAPGRMAPNTALNFLLLGSSLLLLTRPYPPYLAIQFFTIVSFLIALLGMLGYAYNIQSFYGIGSYTKMAVHTAVAFIILSLGILFFRPDKGLMAVVTSDYAGGIMAQRLFLAVIGIPPILGWFILLGFRADLYDAQIGLSLLGVLNIVVFATVIWWNARALSAIDARRQTAETQSRIDALAAARSAAHLTAIIDNLADALLVTDRNCRITRFNPALLTMFSLEDRDLTGQDCQVLSNQKVAELVEQTGQSPSEVFTAEIELTGDRVGQAVATSIGKDSSKDGIEEWIGSVILIRDITAEKEVDRMKTDFISTVSHELRTPLTSVLGFASIIKDKLEEKIFPAIKADDRKTQKTLRQVEANINIIVSEAERLTALINDVLDIAKMEAGKLEWHKEPLSIKEIIDRAIAATSSLFETKGLELLEDVEPGLPEVVGDRDRLIQVAINLISNAIKFTESGSVTCRARVHDGEMIVSVIDSGIGIAPADLPKVFEKFKQVGDTLTDKPKGTGLGLPICKQIVAHHGGRIWVESEPGQGSNFSFSLPIITSGSVEVEKLNIDTLVRQLKEHVVTTSSSPGEQQKTILVVDDDANIRELLRQELEAESYEVKEAKDGMDAINQVKTVKPDLIILDVMMPQINGFDVAAVLKNDPQTMSIPIIVLSIIEDKERGYRLGIDRYLTKPINRDKLLNEIGSLLSQGMSSKKVLVVDKNASTLRILSDVLQAQGYNVVEASSDRECIEKALSIKPDMIIVDSVFSEEHNLVKTLRFEKGLENVFFLLLGDEQT